MAYSIIAEDLRRLGLMRVRFIFYFLIAGVLLAGSFAQKARTAGDSAARQREAAAALKISDVALAETKLRQIQNDAPRDFTANNLDYSLAHALQRAGQLTEEQP